MTDDPIDPELLARYEVPAPAPDLADRFMARLGERAPRRWPWLLLAAAGALAAAVALFVLWPAGHATVTGALAPAQRTSVELGGRGVAVAEPGAKLRWQVKRDAHVDQDAGDVFYRVEHGGAFVVATPAGDVTVTGTCFRVEVALAVTVTVYEGAVDVANAHGRVTLHAGEHATATRDTAPAPQQITGVEARLAEQHARITALEAAMDAGAQRSGSDSPAAIGSVQPTRRPFDMTQAELAKLAAECRLPFDVPPTAGSSLMDKIIEDGMKQADLGDSERAAVKRLIRDTQPMYTNELGKFYTDITGADGSELDPATIVLEIEQKSPSPDIAAAYRKLAAERAGQKAVAGDSIIEQYLRFAMRASDDFEHKLAAEIGPARARAFRRTWGLVDWATECSPPPKDHP